MQAHTHTQQHNLSKPVATTFIEHLLLLQHLTSSDCPADNRTIKKTALVDTSHTHDGYTCMHACERQLGPVEHLTVIVLQLVALFASTYLQNAGETSLQIRLGCYPPECRGVNISGVVPSDPLQDFEGDCVPGGEALSDREHIGADWSLQVGRGQYGAGGRSGQAGQRGVKQVAGVEVGIFGLDEVVDGTLEALLEEGFVQQLVLEARLDLDEIDFLVLTLAIGGHGEGGGDSQEDEDGGLQKHDGFFV